MKLHDKKIVTLLSSSHTDEKVQIIKRGKTFYKHKIVLDYNRCMGGIDLSDSLITMYKTVRNKNNKHYIKQFRHLLDIVCLNSFIIYKKMNGELSRLDFILKLVNQIIEKNYSAPKKRVYRNRPIFHPMRINASHYPKFIPPTEMNLKPRRRCAYCSKKGLRQQTRIFCEKCGVALCAAPCFSLYHVKPVL